MGRWASGARERLATAALELFVEQGFAETTVPQITARAGLTTRTFFRHFADKREVLFGYQEGLPAVVARILSDTSPTLSPFEAVADGLLTIAAEIEDQREQLRIRRSVVETDDGLRERELRKQSVLGDAITAGLRERGVDDLTATLTAHTAANVFGVAVNRWLDDDRQRSLFDHVRDAIDALRNVVGVPDARNAKEDFAIRATQPGQNPK